MARKPTLRAEVEALRAELDALRDAQSSSDRSADDTAGQPDKDADDTPRQEELFEDEHLTQADIEKALNDFVHSVKDEVHERPMVAVALAFGLGIMIGRLSKS